MMKNKDLNTIPNVKIKFRHQPPAYITSYLATQDLIRKNGRIKQPLLTLLQTELLYRYTQVPTEKQMKQFHVFRFYLFDDDYYKLKAKQAIEGSCISLPKKKLAVKREQLSPFQNELLAIYDHEPTELQMQKLENFLYKLFNNLLNKFDAKPEVEMAI
jgi:hypothetical protein